MIVHVVKYDKKRVPIRTDKYRVKHIRFQPAGLMELMGYGGPNDITYLRILATDPLDIFVEDNDADQSKQ